MSEKSHIRDTIVGTVGGGIILAALGWLFAPEKLTIAWDFLRSRIPVPVWALAFGFFVMLLLVVAIREAILEGVERIAIATKEAEDQQRIARGIQEVLDREREAKGSGETRLPAAPPAPFNDDEIAVFQTLVLADGGLLAIAEIARHLGVKQLAVTHVIDGLFERGMVEDSYSSTMGRRLRLSAAGRARAAEEGLLK